MPMKDEDYQVLMKHLNKQMGPNRGLVCPACGNGGWHADGPVALLDYEARTPDGIAQIGKAAMPVAVLTCSRCHYVCQFSWLPIQVAKNG